MEQAKKGETPLGPTGRELFSLDANLFKDDEDATSDIDYDAREQVAQAGFPISPRSARAQTFTLFHSEAGFNENRSVLCRLITLLE